MLTITLGKSDLTAEEVGDRIKITFKQEFKFDPVKRFPIGGFCYNPEQLVGVPTSERFNPEMRAPCSKLTKPLMDKIRQQLKEGKIMEEWVRRPFEITNEWESRVRESFGVPIYLFNHDPSFVYAPPKFMVNQTVYFYGQEGRIWDGVIKEVSKIEALVQGKDLAWIPLESLYISLDEAYTARDLEEKEAKDKAERVARAKSFKVGQEAYFIVMDCGVYKVLKCSIIDMEEHEASIKLDAVVRRSVVDSKDVFHTSLEANLNAFERNRSINPNG